MAAGAEKMLNLMEVGGSLLERVAVGNPLSLVLAASAFVLSLGYLFQLSYRRHLDSKQQVSARRAGTCGRDSRAGSLQSAGPGAGWAQPSGARGERRWGRGERAPAAFLQPPGRLLGHWPAAGPEWLLGHCWPRVAAGTIGSFALTGLAGTAGGRGARGLRNPRAFPVLFYHGA